MNMAHGYDKFEIADVSGAMAKLVKLIIGGFVFSEEFKIRLGGKCLEVEVFGPVAIIDKVEECFTELASFIKKGETFTIYVDIGQGRYEIFYCFDGESVKRYVGEICFPDCGFYPLSHEEVIKAIKSDASLLEAVRKAICEDYEKKGEKRHAYLCSKNS